MPNKCLLLLSFSALFFSACNNDDKKTADPATDAPSTKTETTNSSSTSSTSDSDRATINVTLGGGDMAGAYKAVCKDACCSWGIAGENTFGNQYSENGKGPKELSSFQLIVDDVKEGNKTSKEFTATVSFGELFSETGKSFNINTRNGKNEGSGTVTVDYKGDQATVTIKGTSKEGPTIDLTMTCNKVTTVNNLGQ